MRSLMQFEADPRWYNRLWVRKSIPDRRQTAVSLLVDLSGSMAGAKANAALHGTIVLAETLSRLEVSFAVNWFQDELILFHDYDDSFSQEIRGAIAEMPMETENERPGGHNAAEHNDDGPCLHEAAMALLDRAVSDRILIVVSDGEPAGSHSDEGDLRRVIKEISDDSPEVSLIGIGIGPDTDHVTDFYPNARANVPVDRFAE